MGAEASGNVGAAATPGDTCCLRQADRLDVVASTALRLGSKGVHVSLMGGKARYHVYPESPGRQKLNEGSILIWFLGVNLFRPPGWRQELPCTWN